MTLEASLYAFVGAIVLGGGLGDVLPRCSSDRFFDCLPRYAEFGSKLTVGHSTQLVSSSDVTNDVSSQFRLRKALALGLPVFGHHVGVVLWDSAEKEMSRIDAGRIVAGVAGKEAWRHRRAVGPFICDVCDDPNAICATTDADNRPPVTVGAVPKNAARRILSSDPVEESVHQWNAAAYPEALFAAESLIGSFAVSLVDKEGLPAVFAKSADTLRLDLRHGDPPVGSLCLGRQTVTAVCSPASF